MADGQLDGGAGAGRVHDGHPRAVEAQRDCEAARNLRRGRVAPGGRAGGGEKGDEGAAAGSETRGKAGGEAGVQEDARGMGAAHLPLHPTTTNGNNIIAMTPPPPQRHEAQQACSTTNGSTQQPQKGTAAWAHAAATGGTAHGRMAYMAPGPSTPLPP